MKNINDSRNINSGRFNLVFAYDGLPVSCVDTVKGEVLKQGNGGRGIYLTNGNAVIPFKTLTFKNGMLTCTTASGTQKAVFRISSHERYIALYLEKTMGIPTNSGLMLHFDLNSKHMRAVELDYMSEVRYSGDTIYMQLNYLYNKNPEDPRGGFALYCPYDEEDEDETLVHIWVEQKQPHSRIEGEWNIEVARRWIEKWNELFLDRSSMMGKASNPEELYALVPYAERLNVKQLILFTDTWRNEGFWPENEVNWHIKRKVFPEGEKDLRVFSDYLGEKNIKLSLHWVSGGIGFRDPVYVGKKPDRRLASWGSMTLTGDIDKTQKSIYVIPGRDTELPFAANPNEIKNIRMPGMMDFFRFNYIRIEDEIIMVGEFEEIVSGEWVLKDCTRGMFDTDESVHKSDETVAGLIAPYNINFIPSNDNDMLDEIATGYAGMINRCNISHTEYDGAEIHCYYQWGYRKFSQKIYECLDHPVTAHDSSGKAPISYYHYRFNSVKRTIKGDCPWGHTSYFANIKPYTHARQATNYLDAHHSMSLGHIGTSLGIGLPEPMFGESINHLECHGDTERIIEIVNNWRNASKLMTPEQHALIEESFYQPKDMWSIYNSHRKTEHLTMVRPSKEGGYEVVPVHIMRKKCGDISLQHSQEHGALLPRQYIRNGEKVRLNNPSTMQTPRFIVSVLWDLNEYDRAIPASEYTSETLKTWSSYDLFSANNGGEDSHEQDNRPNIFLQPALEEIQNPGDLVISDKDEKLCIQFKNNRDQFMLDADTGAKWEIQADLGNHRAIAMDVCGDGSGAVLLFKLPSRDYAVKLDFVGERKIVIPNGEVAWYDANWGWRMNTKSILYNKISYCELSIGYIPPHTAVDITVSNIMALRELPVCMDELVVSSDEGMLTMTGKNIQSSDIIEFDGKNAVLYNKNWFKKSDLTVSNNGFVVPSGFSNIGIQGDERINCFYELQMMTESDALNLK